MQGDPCTPKLDAKTRAEIVGSRDSLVKQANENKQRKEAERRADELRKFNAIVEACRQYNVAACDDALRSATATEEDKRRIYALHSAAQQYQANFISCQNLVLTACEAALAYPHLTVEGRTTLQSSRATALAQQKQKETVVRPPEREPSPTKTPSATAPPMSTTAFQSPLFIFSAMLIVGLFYIAGQKIKGKSSSEPLWKQITVGVAVAVFGAVIVKLLGLSDGVSLFAITIAGLLVITLTVLS